MYIIKSLTIHKQILIIIKILKYSRLGFLFSALGLSIVALAAPGLGDALRTQFFFVSVMAHGTATNPSFVFLNFLSNLIQF